MNDVLNVVLLNTNYFKNILINDDKFIINLSLLNKNYYKLINNVYNNYIFDEFPSLKLLNVNFEYFDCKSWIHVYRYIFTSTFRMILLRNIDLESEDFISLNSSLHLIVINDNDYFKIRPPKTNINSPNNFPINYEKIGREFADFFELNKFITNDNEEFISYVNFCMTEMDPFCSGEIENNTSFFKFLRKICSFLNKPPQCDIIYKLINNFQLNISNNNIHIIFSEK